jgi:hypothetical protein
MQVTNSRRSLIVLLILLWSGHYSAAGDSKDYEKFLASQERAAQAEQKRLLVAVENAAKSVRLSDTAPGEKQSRLEAIERDRVALVNEGKLPSADEVLPAVVGVVEEYQKVIRNLETFRQRYSDRAVRTDRSDSLDKIAALEERLNKIVGGRDNFARGSKWSGELSQHGVGRRGKRTRDQSFRMQLSIDESHGNEFRGVLSQIGNVGRASKMDVVGNLDGNQIAFHTTDVTRGKNRSLSVHGYLLSDRIIAKVSTIDVNSNPAIGWVSLWHEVSGKEPARRRGKKSSP